MHTPPGLGSDQESPPRGGGKRRRASRAPSFFSTVSHRELAAYQVSAGRGVVETLATLRRSASARCSWTKAVSGIQLDGFAFLPSLRETLFSCRFRADGGETVITLKLLFICLFVV